MLLGGNGYDTYFIDGKDIIKDDDSKGQIYFNGVKLTDATQIEKNSTIHKTKDGIKYEVKPNQLIVNDSLIIEDFNPYQEYLGITLHKDDTDNSITPNIKSKKQQKERRPNDTIYTKE